MGRDVREALRWVLGTRPPFAIFFGDFSTSAGEILTKISSFWPQVSPKAQIFVIFPLNFCISWSTNRIFLCEGDNFPGGAELFLSQQILYILGELL